MSKNQRGGCPASEIAHAQVLLEHGASETWGWYTVAGRERVKRRARWITNELRLRPGVRVLECGCGTGIFTREIAKTGADIVAIDISAALLEEAARQTSAKNVTFVEGDLESPDILQGERFDAVFGISVLHHLHLPVALDVIKGKAAKGARFAFSEPNILNPINRYYYFVDDMEKRHARGVSPNEMAFSRKELGEALMRHDFAVEQLEYRDFMHPSIPGWLIPFAGACEQLAEALPIVKALSGSIWVSGEIGV